MIGIFSGVRNLLNIKPIDIDDTIFKLHYKATVIILIIYSVMVTLKQYVGDPIDCIVNDPVPPTVMDAYCWVHSTYTVPNRLVGEIGQDMAHPGVGVVNQTDEIKYHKYYQWVVFFLFFQAVLFYMPRYWWKKWENGRIQLLVQQLNYPLFDKEGDKRSAKMGQVNKLANYLSSHSGEHNLYAFKYFLCELLNFVNVVGQIFFMDYFLDGEFTRYGPDVFNFYKTELGHRSDPMDEVFPKVTKCSFHTIGLSGSMQTYDGLCVLPINILNEKIMVFLWYWFLTLAIVSGLQLIFRLLSIIPGIGVSIRRVMLRNIYRLGSDEDVSTAIEYLNAKSSIGDWFLLYKVCKNVYPSHLKSIFVTMAKVAP